MAEKKEHAKCRRRVTHLDLSGDELRAVDAYKKYILDSTHIKLNDRQAVKALLNTGWLAIRNKIEEGI